MPRPRLFLIDTFGFIFRAYHARARSAAPTLQTTKGVPTEAVLIFNNMLRKLTQAYKPEYIAAVFESSAPTFREQEFAEYKANRAAMPPELVPQIGYVRRLLDAMRIPILEYPGFEADDVIGAIARRAEQAGLDVVIVSSDKDMLRLVGERISMYNPVLEDVWYDPAKVQEKMGVRPEQVADLLALRGDAIDNIPGGPGIGDKGARDLIARFGSVAQALERAAELGDKGYGRRYRDSLQQNRERIELSKRLATIDTSVPVEFCLDAVRVQPADTTTLRALYKELEFFSLIEQLGPEIDTRTRDYRALESAEELDAWLAAIPPEAAVTVAVGISQPAGEGDGGFLDDQPQPVIGLAWRTAEARSVPSTLVERLRPLLEDPAHAKIAHDVKQVTLELWRHGIEPRGFEHDVMLYSFLLSADPGGCSLETLARRRLDRKLEAIVEHQADCALEIWPALSAEVDQRGMRKVYTEIDLPLVPVLARMERTGIRVDPAELRRLSDLMDTEIQRLTAEICALAGKSFNINSPQQLGKVLFDRQVRQGQNHLDRGRCPGGPGGRARDRPQGARLPPAHQAQGHLRGRAAPVHRPPHRPAAHQLQPGRCGHRAAVVVQPQPSEHSDSHRAGTRDPCGLHSAGRLDPGGGRLFADRAAPAGALLEGSGAGGGFPPRRGHPHPHRRGSLRRAAAYGRSGAAPPGQGGKLRYRLRAERFRTGGPARHLAPGGPDLHRQLLRALRRRACAAAALHHAVARRPWLRRGHRRVAPQISAVISGEAARGVDR